MTKHDEPDNAEALPAEGEIMNTFEYAVLRHVKDLKEERKKRELTPAEERFLRIVQDLARKQLKAS